MRTEEIGGQGSPVDLGIHQVVLKNGRRRSVQKIIRQYRTMHFSFQVQEPGSVKITRHGTVISHFYVCLYPVVGGGGQGKYDSINVAVVADANDGLSGGPLLFGQGETA